MTDFASAHAADGEARALAEACAAQLGDPDGHTLGFVYATDPLAGALGDIVEILKSRTGIADWIGTVGIGVCAPGTEHFGHPAISVLTGRFAGDAYRMLPSIDDPDDVAPALDANFMAGLGVVHGDPRNAQTIDIVSVLGGEHGLYLVGGISAAESAFPQVAGDIVDGGVSGVLLGGKLGVAVGLTQGCYPIGPTHDVSGGEGNLLVSLDDRPALEVLCEDLGVADGADPRPWLNNIHAALPVAGSDMGDYLVRNLIGIEPSEGLVAIADEVAPGDRLLFVRRDAESAAKDLKRMLEDLQVRAGGRPKAGLYYSCVARGPNLFDDEAHELTAIRDVFGDIPIAGFFGNGEISNDRVYG
ncbi:MAG: FIST signal transduction protein, partial [Hyphomicrobiales bacterium]